MLLLSPLTKTIHGVMEFTWPMLFISIIIIVSLRVTYLYKQKEHVVFYKELLMLAFIIYILCLFQVVTFQDVTSYASNNFIPFKEIMRYHIGSRLFFKNVLGNMLLFFPYGFFIGYYVKLEKYTTPFFLILMASIAIECTQLAIGRVFDVDDILLNIIGGLLGFSIYKCLDKIGSICPSLFHKEWFLNILSILVVVGMIVLVL